MDNLDNLPDGVAARLRALEDEDDDDVDHSILTTWGVNNASDVFRSEAHSSRPASSASSKFTASESSRNFARAFAPLQKRLDPYESRGQHAFSFSSAVPAEPHASTWDTYDPTAQDQSETSRKSRRQDSQESATGGRADVNDPRNKALEGTFGSTSVKRVTEENSGWLDLTLPDLDPDLEDPNLNIDPNVRANFLPISELYRAQVKPSAFARRNPTLVASNTGGSISTIIAGETITYTPKSGDTRLSRLDRHGKYIGKYEGEIKKSLKWQYKEDVKERDRQMLQATAEYRTLAAMGAEERADLLERLRKPYEWQGAFDEDQHDEPHIPEAYTRDMPTDRLLTWMEDDFSRISIESRGATAPSTSGSVSDRNEDSLNSDASLGDFGGLDDFAAGSSFVPIAKPTARTQQYFRDALHYGRKQSSRRRTSQCSSSTVGAQIAAQFDRPQLSDAGTSQSFTPTASSCGSDDPLFFDDSPEIRFPDDCAIEPEAQMSPKQAQFYKEAITLSEKHGRVVLVHLHQLVKFTPGAIASRVFGGVIQEMQLFPVQRVAIVIFLYPSEAKSFVRHVKKVHESGLQGEIRGLQIEAGWYKGSESHSALPIQPLLLTYHLTTKATRCLRLHHLPASLTKESLSATLADRLALPLLTVILCREKLALSHRAGRALDPRLDSDAPLGTDARRGRQAIVEFVSIGDAIRARKLLVEGAVWEFEGCEPVFAADPSAGPGVERAYCSCAWCRYLRELKGGRDVAGRA